MVSGLRWGADPSISLILYKATIRSLIDYGSVVYGGASNTLLNKLEVVHHKCIRICIGFLRSTPINVLLAESGELPSATEEKSYAQDIL